MCEPVSLAAIGTWAVSAAGAATIAAVSTGVGIFAQSQSAKAQAAAIATQTENERLETVERNEEDLGQRIRASREARSRARVAAGESGALGASFAASMNQAISDQNLDAALVQKNVAFANRATDDRSNSALASIRHPSALSAGLQIGTAGLSGFNAGKAAENRTP